MTGRISLRMLLLLGSIGLQVFLAKEPRGEVIRPADAGVVSSICGTSFGTRFNLEPRTNAQLQSTQAVDVLRNRVAASVDLVVGGSTDGRGASGLLGGSQTGYYVSRDADCAAEFEGGLPAVADPLEPGTMLFGGGTPVVAADPARDTVFMADLRSVEFSTSGVAVFRSPAATLLSPTACPSGTHTAAQAATCWPTRRVVLASQIAAVREPHLAVDERTSGTGAGNVYIVATEEDFDIEGGTRIRLVACTNTLASCASPIIISAPNSSPQFAHLAIRPDGKITITWINVTGPFPATTFQILYRSCTPAGAPRPPTCTATSLVHTETQGLNGNVYLATHSPIATHPKHDHRIDANGTETYVVWERCKVVAPLIDFLGQNVCPDVDVVLKASHNNGATWSALTCVACGSEDQFFPALRTDRSRNIVNLALYSSATDPTFQRQVRIIVYHINPGPATPDPTDSHVITTLLNDPGQDNSAIFHIGFSIGVAARGTGADGASRAYIHYTYNNIQGIYSGVQLPDPNNHLSRLDY